MERLIIHGDPGVRRDGIVEVDGEQRVLFQVSRNGDWHGPDRVQLWCIAGDEDERVAYDTQDYVPHFLEVRTADAEDVEVVKRAGDLAV